MKRTIVSLAIIITAALSVQAQQPGQSMKQGHHKQAGHHGRDRLSSKLNLSDQQKEQLKTINSDYHKKMMDLKKNEDITVRESKAQLKALHKARHEQIQALFTPEQKQQLASMKKDRMEMARINAAARAEKMKVKLGLTDAQTGQLKDMHAGMAAKMKALRTDSSLSREQKHEQFKTLALQQKEQLKTVLTPAQLQQLEQMKKEHRKRDFAK